ncbi:SIR2 family protein [Clostridium estertheticum]|uniref:SIR2 family protein n=1 Tax=Clostridium estertheticum TaxID=238834 RepID=UPI001CF40CE2|nr:SIR2 family protein [Clostridium estertheticum]MCB2357606.1 SIR2 family protein [Clostridium estertheticum]
MSFNINKKIIDAMKEDKLILFIGAGFSNSLKFPDWNEIVKRILKDLSTEEEKYNSLISALEGGFFTPIEILEKIKDKKDEIYETIHKSLTINDDMKIYLDNQKKAWQISSKIITTNYDNALEYGNSEIKVISYNYVYEIAKLMKSNQFLLKLHGSTRNMADCILFKEDYEKLYNSKEEKDVIFQLKKIISDYTILFIGFSLKDPYVLNVFEGIHKMFSGFNNRHFIVSKENDDFSKYGTIIQKIDDWTELGLFLDQLISEKKKYT